MEKVTILLLRQDEKEILNQLTIKELWPLWNTQGLLFSVFDAPWSLE